MSSNNDHVAHLVDDLVHDLLSPDEVARAEDHCLTCRACRRALQQARRRLSLLQAMPATEASSSLVRDTLNRIDEASKPSSALKRFGLGTIAAIAASIALLIGLQIYYANLKASTIDLVLLGQRELLAATTASLRIRLVDRQSNLALSGIPIVVTLRGPDGTPTELASFTTDQEGTGSPRFQLPDWADGSYRLEVTAQTPSGRESLVENVKLKRGWKLLLTSDKPVYQPGQTILLRSLALRRPDLRPVADRSAVFTVTDPRGNVIFKRTRSTSQFGIASAECELADEIREGNYLVRCNVEGTESRLSLEVRRYVLPKFKLTLEPNRPYYSPGEKADVRLQANYFFGKPVREGRLDYEITTRDGQLLSSGTASTNAKGETSFQVLLPAQLVGHPQDQGDARLLATAMLTDKAGQKQVTSTNLLVTNRPIRVQLLPEAGKLVTGVENNVFVLVQRADGQPLSKVNVSIDADSFQTQVATDERGVAVFPFTPQWGELPCTVRVTDARGEVLARSNERLTVSDANNDFLLRLDRAVLQAGQSLTLSVMGAGVEPVFVDFIKDGQTMLSETIEMRNGQGELILDLPQELFGTLQMVAYRFDNHSGLPLRKARVLYVAPPESLRIHATLDKKEYQPGKAAMLNLRLTDDEGNATPGALSLVAVDEAVYSVLTQKPGMEKTFYNLEQELLKPVYAIYPWQPNLEPDVERRDLALFTTTNHYLDNPPSPQRSGSIAPQVSEVGPHTLATRTLPAKQQELEQLKRDRLDLIKRGWIVLLLVSLMSGYLALWAYVPLMEMLKFHAFGFVGALFLGALAFLFLGTYVGHRFDSVKMATASRDLAGGMAMKSEAPSPRSAKGSSASLPRVRKEFPETLLWKPELITDDEGKLPPMKISLADSITTWRLTASAVSADGRLGVAQLPIKVFQPFFVDLNLPVSMTRGDEVGLPVVIYNYLDSPQIITLTLKESPWFTLSGPSVQQVALNPGEVRSTRYTIRVNQVGRHALQVVAQAGDVGDALERVLEVVPDGRKIERAINGDLSQPVEQTLTVPDDAIDGSVKAFVKVYPSGFSQLVEGLENVFRMPSGCFEQTSSTTYPNVLALHYLRTNHLSVPSIEAKARQYVHLGYQRLLSFEVSGGGFDWYGRPPANVLLTAYGLMEFVDMAQVHDVDPQLIRRTRSWLLSRRNADGSWEPEVRGQHFVGVRDREMAKLATTAYVAWAVGNQQNVMEALRTVEWLLSHRPEEFNDPHVLALVCNALLALDPSNAKLEDYLKRLIDLGTMSEDRKHFHWSKPRESRTLFYGSGESAQIETTALATLALLKSRQHGNVSTLALHWLVSKKDSHGTWYSTQATVLALKALLAGSQTKGDEQERRLVVSVGNHDEEIVIPADQAEVMKTIDVSRWLRRGENRLSIRARSKTQPSYQIVFRYHVPEPKEAATQEALSIALSYDRTELTVGGSVKVRATVTNQQAIPAPMVMLDLPIPPGFAANATDFDSLVDQATIAKYQILPRSVLVYLRELEPGAKLELTYSLEATMPVRVAGPAGKVYEYYDPKKEGRSKPQRFVVKPSE